MHTWFKNEKMRRIELRPAPRRFAVTQRRVLAYAAQSCVQVSEGWPDMTSVGAMAEEYLTSRAGGAL